MTKWNPVLIERTGVRADKVEEARTAYQTPDVVAAGTAIKLVQGPMLSTSRDQTNSGYVYFGVM